MKPTLSLLALVLAAAPLAAQSYPENTGAPVTDLAGVLTRRQEDSLRALLAPVRNRGGDVRVVTIESISDHAPAGTPIETLATGIFNAWRVGDRPENDGTLLLVAVRDRKVRIELGDGAPYWEDRAREVIETRMVPEFRQEDYAAGILAAAGEIAAWYAEPRTASAPAAGVAQPEVDPFSTQPTPQPAYTPPAYTPPSSGGAGRATGFGLTALGVGAIGVLIVGGMVGARYRKRKCPSCKIDMARLDEAADDEHLDSGQQLEEVIGSVDYDVWRCGTCNHHSIVPHAAWLSGFSACGRCGRRTLSKSTRTLEAATYTSSGLQEISHDCRHCGYHDRHTVTLPQLVRHESPRSSSSSDSSWGGGSSGGSSWSGGGSSDGSSSGGGGGTSSGRGASGSW
jgi:uncharacterized protein